ncbi:hypothetical protein JL722_9284 [Aureococcus anophagefferens]|nr:hypothetical protein JL722_9284 [Aureococcus anophagefferens]
MDCDASTDDDDYYEWLRAPDSDEDVLPDDDDRAAPEPLEHRLSTGSATNEVAAIDSIAVEDSLSQTLHSPAARPTGAGRGRDVVWTPTRTKRADEQRRLRVAAAVAALGRQQRQPRRKARSDATPAAAEEETVLDLRRSATAERVVAALEPARRATRVRATLQSSTLARLPPPLLSLQLTSLGVSYCANLNVVAVDAIAAARTLRSLAARHVGSGLEALPASWAALSLARLDASENRLHRWPSALFKFPLDGAKTPLAASLVALDLSRNLLVDVPASVGCLGALEALDLRDNSLATVGDALFSSPPSLRRLDLSSNPNLVDLPPTVAAFVSRPGSSLLLRDNAQLRAPPSAVVAGGSDAVVKFYGTLSDADAALDRQRRRAYLARRDRSCSGASRPWNAGGGSLLFQRDVSRGGGARGGAFPETSAITPEPGEFVAVLERCGDNLELCFLNACASVAIARRIVHDLPSVKEAYDAAVAAFKQKYVVGNPHRRWPRRQPGVPAMLRGGVTPTKSHRRESSPQWPADRAVGASRGAQSAMAC